jgi:Rieske 2Fe-2S family protein
VEFVKPRLERAAKTLEARWYCSPAVFAAERERVFARDWVCAARVEDVPRPGDFVLADVAGENLIVTRGNDDRIRAFFNVCRHRGTQLCTEPSGRFGGSIQCPYHAWTYALDGTLLTARTMADAPDFTRADYPLHEASVAALHGFVFVTLRSDPLGELRTARTISYEVACNWKLIFQNYSECYHCPLIHPQLDRLSPSDSGRNDLIDGPFLGGFSELRRHGTSLTTGGVTTRPPIRGLSDADRDRIYYYTIFPSLLLSLHPDYAMVHFVRPLAYDRTSIACAWLFEPETIDSPGSDPSDAVDFWDLTNRQDWPVSELTQRGVSSRAYTPGPYANAEGLLAAFDRHYLAVMQGA